MEQESNWENKEIINGIDSIENKLDKQNGNENYLENVLNKMNDIEPEKEEQTNTEPVKTDSNNHVNDNLAGYPEVRHIGYPYGSAGEQDFNELACKMQNAGQGAPEDAV